MSTPTPTGNETLVWSRMSILEWCAAGAAEAAAGAVAAGLGRGPFHVLGPAPLFRLRGRERSQVVVKALDRDAAVAAVGQAVAQAAPERAHRAVSFSVDVDPQ